MLKNNFVLCTTFFVVFASTFAILCNGQSHWFNEVVKSGAVDCFYEVLEERVPVRATAVVVDGGSLDIRLIVQHSYSTRNAFGMGQHSFDLFFLIFDFIFSFLFVHSRFFLYRRVLI